MAKNVKTAQETINERKRRLFIGIKLVVFGKSKSNRGSHEPLGNGKLTSILLQIQHRSKAVRIASEKLTEKSLDVLN